ncbi:MAG: hypothetical protein F4210_07075 [Holophagales bacterium]|nr:hypothetical protein [Holophagales bacterium]MYF95257.1 hypothetical protein [Holophagales bacterium]
MVEPTRSSYDIAIVGAGPVGSFCALVHARKGARVALLEANLKASRRLAGEWLHPAGLRMLRDAGIRLEEEPCSNPGKGFVVLPEGHGEEPIVLPYSAGSSGLSCDHATIVSKLREAAQRENGVDFICGARVREVEDGRLTFARQGAVHALRARRVVGADGRASIVRKSLGLSTNRVPCSWMVGLLLERVSLPFPEYGHVLLGGPGPVFMYGLGEQCVRVMVDVPLEHRAPRDRIALLADSYAAFLPEALKCAFLKALREKRVSAAANEIRVRMSYGTPDRVLIGDAAGHHHPITAMGLTLGFEDALALAEGGDFDEFSARRLRSTRAPELLANGLYEVFVDHRAEVVAVRQAVYRRWRANPALRERTMALLACEDTSTRHLVVAFAGLVARASARVTPRSLDRRAWRRARGTVRALALRLGWFLRALHQLVRARKAGRNRDRLDSEAEERVRDTFARAFPTSMPPRRTASERTRPTAAVSLDADSGLRRATAHVLALQGEDGAWEAELVWCPMLTAQYVLVHHILGLPPNPGRRRRLLRYFERTRLGDGQWGFHRHSPPHLFVTTLVYVAARLLGVASDDPLLVPARRFIQGEGVTSIPSWGKFWLALLNLYDWRGVNPILPELSSLPRRLPLHPSNWYCHSRLIYTAMALIYSHRFSTPVTPTITALREELFPEGFAGVDFAASRNRLREADLYIRPTVWLRSAYLLARVFERFHGKRLRARCTTEIVRRIRWELRATTHANLSPLNGLLAVLALWLRDAKDPDLPDALAQLERWVWEDAKGGTRVALQRTPTWDTGFAQQALATAPALEGVRDALRRGAHYLSSEQVGDGFDGFLEVDRADPSGGWCLGRAWQGWPVSDCTAEAVLGILAGRREAANAVALEKAVRFMLHAQNANGGFGSYEARRTAVGLEWLNPSEMFADAMTENSYVECTASCLAALAACQRDFPRIAGADVANAVSRGGAWLRRTQANDGSWPGTWGIHFIYGTLFGVRGLVAAGARPGDPALGLACGWLLDRQRSDGAWGEHHSSCLAGRFVQHPEGQVVQTAWALIALLEANDGDWSAITRGVGFLLDTQEPGGGWPRQDAAGVYARSGILEYPLYRQYFPLHALGLYERRRRARPARQP